MPFNVPTSVSILEPLVDPSLPSFNAEMTILGNAMNQTPVTEENTEKLKTIVSCIETIKNYEMSRLD
jgi:hypothetical protein